MSERPAQAFAIPLFVRANIPEPAFDEQDGAPGELRALRPLTDLVGRAQRGDRDAFGEIYQAHRAAIFRMARMHLGADAEDVVSEVFLRAWVALPRYRETGAPFVSWLYGIARHVVWDELARRKRVQPQAELPDAGVEPNEDDRMTLEAAIANLPDEQRQVIELKFLVGMRNPDVADALGISIGAVNAKQWRALGTLRGLLEEKP